MNEENRNVLISLGSLVDVRKAGVGVMLAVLLAACGGGGGSASSPDTSGSSSGSTSSGPALALFAGNMGGAGNLDGKGAAARFNAPRSVAVDSSGNVFVADTGNNTIRKIASGGVVTTLAGTAGASGLADGAKGAARFNVPAGVATDSSGNIYVADTINSDIRKITPVGVASTLAGTGKFGFANGTGTAASFYMPTGVATDSSGNVYVADADNNVIREISPSGAVTTLAGGVLGNPVTVGSTTSSSAPVAVAVDGSDNVYVADTNNTIIMIAPGGVVTTLAGTAGVSGSADGTGAAASFNGPSGIAVDSLGNVYVADSGNNTIRVIAPGGVVTTFAGTAGATGAADGTAAAASFDAPSGVATDSSGNVYVADTNNNTVRMITAAGVVTTLAGAASVSGSADANTASATFDMPAGIAADTAGNLYVADFYNHTIRKITNAGAVTTLAGTAGVTGSADGAGSLASFNGPSGVAADAAGNVYVADAGNATIRKITAAGVVSTLAGTAGVIGSANGTGSAASFSYPDGIAVDSAGNVYVADSGNLTIRKITATGVVTVLAGKVGARGSANGTGTAASFNFGGKFLDGIAVDSSGNVYLADNNNFAIRMITAGGAVSTLAGGQAGSSDGSGTAASFGVLNGLALDSAGNLYVADDSLTIRKVTAGGVVTTVVGAPGEAGFSPGTLPGSLPLPLGVAVSGTSLYISAANGVGVVSNRP